MGGYGSGFQWSRKFVGLWTRGSLRWSYEGCEPHARIGYEANLIDPDAAWLRLTARILETDVRKNTET